MSNAIGPRVARRPPSLALALVLALSVVAISPSLAVAKCQPGRANNGQSYFAGGNRIQTNIKGVTSQILNYSPWVQPGSEVSAWVMLTLSSDHRWWSQIGWYEEANDNRHTFTQYTDSPNHWWTDFWWPPEPVNTYTTYKVAISGTSFIFYVNGVIKKSAFAAFTPNEAQDFGELHTLASQMPGAALNLEWFKSMQILSAGTWSNFSPTVWTTNNTYFTATWVNSAAIYIRDKACTGS